MSLFLRANPSCFRSTLRFVRPPWTSIVRNEVISSGAELLGVERDGRTLELTFYAPARATVRLHLESQPTKVELEPDFRLESRWKQETANVNSH